MKPRPVYNARFFAALPFPQSKEGAPYEVPTRTTRDCGDGSDGRTASRGSTGENQSQDWLPLTDVSEAGTLDAPGVPAPHLRERGGAGVSVLATIAALVIVVAIVIGGYQLGWWLRANEVNRSAEINRKSFEVQQTYREKALDHIADVRMLDSQIADPAYAESVAQLRAQRTALIRQTCDAISRLTTSGAGVDLDVQSFHDTECAQ